MPENQQDIDATLAADQNQSAAGDAPAEGQGDDAAPAAAAQKQSEPAPAEAQQSAAQAESGNADEHDPADDAMDAVASIESQLGQMLSNLGGMDGGEQAFGEIEQPAAAVSGAGNIDLLSDVLLNVKIELGRSRMYIEDILKLGEGSVVELEKLAGDPVDVFVNDRLVARGEVLVLNDNFCVRIGEIISHD